MSEHQHDMVGDLFLEGLYELCGTYLPPALTSSRAPRRPGEIQQALEAAYGTGSACGVALRSGREVFRPLLKREGPRLGLTSLDYRLKPSMVRLKLGLERLATLLSQDGLRYLSVAEAPGSLLLRVKGGAGKQESGFLCGLIQEYFTWASGGKIYAVKEVESPAVEDADIVLRIDLKPLE